MLRVLKVLMASALSLATAAHADWYKGVTHVHSLWSDGDTAPEVIAAWYKEHGWNFVAFSDHNILQAGDKFVPVKEGTELAPQDVEAIQQTFGKDWVQTKEDAGSLQMRLKTQEELKKHFDVPGNFLLFPAEEITSNKGPHVNGINVREAIPGEQGDYSVLIQKYIDQVKAQREKYKVPMFAHVNHVNFSNGITIEELLKVHGLEFFEVYNGHPAVHNWGNPEKGMPNTDRHWDVIQAINLLRDPNFLLRGMATDDSHKYKVWAVGQANPGRGWVMVQAGKLEANALVQAMLDGNFYASTGVVLDNIKHDAKSLHFQIKPKDGVKYHTLFIGTRRGFDKTSEPVLDPQGAPMPRASHKYSDEIGAILAESNALEPRYDFKGDELYVRAKIISDRLQENPFDKGDVETAWVQPVLVR